MSKKIAFFGFIALLAIAADVQAVPELRLPFPGGEIWECSQGNYDDPKAPNDTH